MASPAHKLSRHGPWGLARGENKARRAARLWRAALRAKPSYGFLGLASRAIWMAWARTISSGPSMACMIGVMIGMV